MAFDLDNEELKATRKLHNQDDGLYEETSDKNVENIETTNNKNKYTYIKEVAEKIVNEYREKYKGEKFCPEPSEQTCMAYEILHLLAEREQDKKRIQELEEERKKYIVQLTDEQYRNLVDTIRREVRQELEQKVKDKIEKYNKKMEEDAGHPNWVVTDRIVMNVLQELLEKEENRNE